MVQQRPPAKNTLQTTEWVPNAEPPWRKLLRVGVSPEILPSPQKYKTKKNQIKTNNCFEGLHSKCMDKLQEMSQKGESERKLA